MARSYRNQGDKVSLLRYPGSKLAGTWENAQLGKITLKGDVLETNEWRSKFARRKEADGGDKIVLVDPPWVGFDFVVAKDGTLVLDLGQERYAFTKR